MYYFSLDGYICLKAGSSHTFFFIYISIRIIIVIVGSNRFSSFRNKDVCKILSNTTTFNRHQVLRKSHLIILASELKSECRYQQYNQNSLVEMKPTIQWTDIQLTKMQYI